MKSIRDVYKIGKGPSSSHTMGPERAARLFLSKYPDAETYRVVLYGSLSKTGRGHGTDRVLYEVLGRERTEVVFSEETPHSLPHPNTLDFFACREGKPYATMRVASVRIWPMNRGTSLKSTMPFSISSALPMMP